MGILCCFIYCIYYLLHIFVSSSCYISNKDSVETQPTPTLLIQYHCAWTGNVKFDIAIDIVAVAAFTWSVKQALIIAKHQSWTIIS